MSIKNKSKTTRPGLSKKPRFVFHWWMALLGALFIAVVGIAIIKLSHASNSPGVLYPNMSDMQTCSPLFGEVKSLYVCGGNVVSTESGNAWQTSVNTIGGFQWYGPYETLTTGSGDTNIRACVNFRDNLPFGVQAQFVLDITSDNGQTVLASRTITGQQGAFKNSANSITTQCVAEDFSQPVTLAKNRVYNNVEYRIRMLKGSIDIFQMTRSFGDSISSNVALPTTVPTSPCPVGSLDGGDAKIYGQNRVDIGKTIHLCKIDNVFVNLSIAQNLINMRAAAANAGITLPMVIGYRSFDEQVALRQQNCHGANVYTAPASACSPPTAIPGTSNHGLGEAVDFVDATGARLNWLKQNAAKYGFYNLPSEPWHWSLTGR